MPKLVLYEDYSREEVHAIFDPATRFTPQAGTWGLHGIVQIPERPLDYVFFVTFGQRQAEHAFDEGITMEGVLRWQSQPRQRLQDRTIQNFVNHDSDEHSIYIFLRTADHRDGNLIPYTYLGRLKYLDHDRERDQPVYFTWQILEWNLPEDAQQRMHLQFEGAGALRQHEPQANQKAAGTGLVKVESPNVSSARRGVSTSTYERRVVRDYAEQDARNRRLGLAGEEAVLQNELESLVRSGRPDLAERILHVAKIEGDGAGYDIKSFTVGGDEKFIEVKTTRGNHETEFYLSASEARFAAEHVESFYLYRVFEFDTDTRSGKFFVHNGDLSLKFSLKPILFKVVLS